MVCDFINFIYHGINTSKEEVVLANAFKHTEKYMNVRSLQGFIPDNASIRGIMLQESIMESNNIQSKLCKLKSM
jgi:hypothetical protein